MKGSRATLLVAALALVSRLGVALWAFGRVEPVADGVYYHIHAQRLAEGLGYTWLWPDGTVTYAAHYPVGYPAAISAVYAALGPVVGYAMIFNALLGALGAVALHRAALLLTSQRAAWFAGLAFALHPALVSYTPALMTEGVTAALLALALWAAVALSDASNRTRWLAFVSLAAIVGTTTLVRPQSILLAPLFAFVALGHMPLPRRLLSAVAVLLLSLAVVLPWTARNCDKLGRCALVSVNGGWNLLIGTDPEAKGSWAPIKVPEACASEFDEAEKDVCFEREALRVIRAEPVAWALLAPKKLAATFDYCGAGPWYLHQASPESFGGTAKLVWGALETLVQRLLLAAALAVAALTTARAWTPPLRRAFVYGALGLAVLPWAWLGVLVFTGLGLAPPAGTTAKRRVALGLAATVTGTTALIHAIFFGAGRYGLVIVPGLALAAACLRWPFDTAPENPDD